MKYKTQKIVDVTRIKDTILTSWLNVTNSKPVIVHEEWTPENEYDKEKISHWGTKHTYLRFVTVNKNVIWDIKYTLQNKDKIIHLISELNESILSKGCVMCGYISQYETNYRRKTCSTTNCQEHGGYLYEEKCDYIRNRMLKHLNKIRHKIFMIERKSICEYCNKEYHQIRKDGKFCSTKCRVGNHRKIKMKELVE